MGKELAALAKLVRRNQTMLRGIFARLEEPMKISLVPQRPIVPMHRLKR